MPFSKGDEAENCNRPSRTSAKRKREPSSSDVVTEQNNQVSFVTAIDEKFRGLESCLVDVEIFMRRASALANEANNATNNDLIIPENLVLTRQSVDHCGQPTSDMIEKFLNVVELDVSENLLKSWKEVFTILQHFPRMSILNLSFNPLEGEFNPSQFDSKPLDAVQQLVLNGTKLPFDVVCNVTRYFPNLKQLFLSLNEYEAISAPVDFKHDSIESIHLNHTRLKSLEHFKEIGRVFPCLLNLVCQQSPICSVSNNGSGIVDLFSNLRSLNLSFTNLSSWSVVEDLGGFPSLCELRLKDIPLFNDLDETTRRQLTIARLPKITTLNASQISAEEREDAERSFLRYYMDNEHKPPRYEALCEIHGDVPRLVDIDLSVMAPKRVTVKVIFEEKHSIQTIDIRQTVADFKRLLSKFCGLPTKQFRLFFCDKDPSCILGPEELKYDKRALHTFKVKDGDEFKICRR